MGKINQYIRSSKVFTMENSLLLLSLSDVSNILKHIKDLLILYSLKFYAYFNDLLLIMCYQNIKGANNHEKI